MPRLRPVCKTSKARGDSVKLAHKVFHKSSREHFSVVKDDLALFNGVFSGNLVVINLEPVRVPLNSSSSSVQASDVCGSLHHQQLGNISNKYLKVMVGKESVLGLKSSKSLDPSCDVCPLAKNTKIPHSGTRPQAPNLLNNIHVDLSGIQRCKALNLEMYYILFYDDHLSLRHIYPLKSKITEEVFNVCKSYIALVKRHTGFNVIQFTLDGGGEFINSIMDA